MQSFGAGATRTPTAPSHRTPVAGDQEKDGARYTFGIDPERTRSGAANLIVYNDHLYIGEYNDEEIALERVLFAKTGKNANGQFGGGLDCRFINANLEQSVNLYRMDRNENMELVVGNATKMFPNGSLSGLGWAFSAARTSTSGGCRCTMASCMWVPLTPAACWSAFKCALRGTC